jgi:hypothetical protein
MTAQAIYSSLSPMDRDNFLTARIIDKVTESDFWAASATPTKITKNQIQIVVTELSYDPYGLYAVLKFPILFQQHNLLEQTLKKVTFDEIYDFVNARKENILHF